MVVPPPPRRYFLCTGECVEYKDLYKFPNSHIMGHLAHVIDEGRHVTAMRRWDVSMPACEVPPVSPDIDEDCIGDVRRIKCRHPACKRKQNWEIGKAGYLALKLRYEKEKEHEPVA